MVSDGSAHFLLLNEIADEIALRLRRGERPSLEEYQQQHPELADDLAELIPALVQVEQVKDECLPRHPLRRRKMSASTTVDLESVPAVLLGDVSLSLRGWLVGLKLRRRLRPLLREAILEEFQLRQAARAGLAVDEAQLQAAADDFRRLHGLNSAQQTQAWLQAEGLSADDFEAVLERQLLLGRLEEHVTAPHVAGHFAAHRERYDRARLRQIVVDRLDLARELLSQFHEDGRDFADLAGRHSRHAASRELGGKLGELFRTQMPAVVAEGVFAAQLGDVVGPFSLADGHFLFLVEATSPAVLDAATARLVRRELFQLWLDEQLRGAALQTPLAEALR